MNVQIQQWMACKQISFIDIIYCDDSADAVCLNDAGRENMDQDLWYPGDSKAGKVDTYCCDNGDGTATLKYQILIHDGGEFHECYTDGLDALCSNGRNNNEMVVAFEIDFGPGFCDNCYLDKTTITEGTKATADCESSARDVLLWGE
jgi:hypothetical protein